MLQHHTALVSSSLEVTCTLQPGAQVSQLCQAGFPVYGLCHLNPVLDKSKYLMCIIKDDLLQNLITNLSALAPVIPPLQDKGNDFHIHL